jgi:predicted amidophosphoribosyltransferase
MEKLVPADQRCRVCELPLKDGKCGNPICSWDDRRFIRNHAIAMRSGKLKEAILRFKYENKYGWGPIFGRVLVGFLDENRNAFEGFDLIVASPGFLDPEGEREYDHARRVIHCAAIESDGRWPFDTRDPAAVIKTKATTRLAGKNAWKDRHQIALTELRSALSVPDPLHVKGKTILVYDDVFTDGMTLNEVSRALRKAGASSVSGVSLTRQPWGGAA